MRMRAVKVLFGEWRKGRIARVEFVAYSLLIWAMLYGLLLLQAWPVEGQIDVLQTRHIGTSILVLPAAAIAALLGTLNLSAKRIRDMGAPGWLSTIGITAVNAGLIFVLPGFAYPWFSIAVFLALAVVPSDLF